MIEGVFFDLDGTLIDSAPDLAKSINRVLVHEGKAPLPYSQLRPFVSGGSPALIKIGFGIEPGDTDFDHLKQLFLNFYEESMFDNTAFFDGVDLCLETIESQDIPWGIVTNKPDFLTVPLVKELGLTSRASVIVSGDTYIHKKPHPYPLIKACEISQVAPVNSIYVGDDQRDIIAAKAANMISICAEWGYLSNQDPSQWQADYYVKHSRHLASTLSSLLASHP